MTRCSNCGGTGHTKRNCPRKRGSSSRKRAAPSSSSASGEASGDRGGRDQKQQQPHVPPPPHKRAKLSAGAVIDPVQEAIANAAQADAEAAEARRRAEATVAEARRQAEASARPAEQRAAAARAALALVFAEADPDDLPCLPEATRVNGGRRFPWKIALQFASARDLAAGLARTHRAARAVCNHRATVERIVKARHGRGCKRASDKKQDGRCAGCARVALLLGPVTAEAPSRLGPTSGPGSCWLRRLDHTERAAAHQAELRRRAAAAGLAEGADGRGATGAIVRLSGATGPHAHTINGVYDCWEVNADGSAAFLQRGSSRASGMRATRPR